MNWKDLFCNRWFKKLTDYGDRWGIAHLSFDNESIAEIFDSHFDRLIETWESLLCDLQAQSE